MATNINFPTSPTVGQVYTYVDGTNVYATYVWNGTIWQAQGDIGPIGDTGVALSLTNKDGVYYNMSAANAGTTYTTTGTTLGAFCVSRVNSVTEPVVTGATKIDGTTFVSSTDIHLWVQYFGATVQYWFAKL
tara:strand:+ start:1105 stop:1500 length:396 start_codon:yes stop_codon:yes gene_type:complete